MIRDATAADTGKIAPIYAHHVLHGVASYETEPPGAEEMRGRIERVHDAGWSWLVFERDGRTVGYTYATQMRDRAAYRYTFEDSVYVAADHLGQGIGRALLEALIVRVERVGARQLVAVIGGAEPASIALHAAFGFHEIGRIEGAGRKFGRWLDSVYMQRAIGDGIASDPAAER